MYTPINSPNFSNNKLTVFDGVNCEERIFVPWLVKENMFKGCFGFGMLFMWDLLFPLGSFFTMAAAAVFAHPAWHINKLM